MIRIRIKKSIDNNIDTKLPNVFDYWKGLSQNANKLMDGKKEADITLTKVSLFFLVVIEKSLTLTFLGCQ